MLGQSKVLSEINGPKEILGRFEPLLKLFLVRLTMILNW